MDGTDSVSASQVFAGDAAAFLAHEADLLDAGRFDDWLDLFDEDGIYWVPSSRDQTDMDGQVSIMLEDKPLLKLRITRLSHPRAHSVLPPPATVHLIGNVVAETGPRFVMVQSKLVMNMVREDEQTSLSGSVLHHLLEVGGGYRILLKRIDLIQAGGIFSAISVPI